MRATDFNLPDQNGNIRSLKDFAGKWLVLYFYPEDDTPGCTAEACSFRDARELIAELGNVEVAGISKDSVESHKKFADKHNLSFTLLSDTSHDTIKAYGSWDEEYKMAKRDTFIISPEGEIAKEYRGVDPSTHAAQIIKDLKELQKAQNTD